MRVGSCRYSVVAQLLRGYIADLRQIRVHVRAEVAQAHERLAAGVFDLRRRAVAASCVMNTSSSVSWPKRIMAGVCKVELADAAAALHGDPAAGAGVLQRALRARLDASVPWR